MDKTLWILSAVIGVGAISFGIWQESFSAAAFMYIFLAVLAGMEK